MNQELQASLQPQNLQQLTKQAYLTSPLQQEQQPQSKQTSQDQERAKFLEEADINLTPTADQIYKEHREFLQNYKRQRQREREAQTSQNNQARRSEHRHSASVNQQAVPSKESQELVMQKLLGIQQKLAQEIASKRSNNDRPVFKIFTQVVQTKNDIQRVSKERRFLRSQQSKYYKYSQPAMPARSKLPAGLRVRTEGILDQVELGRNAREFIERVHKEQERLLGKHLLRRKIEEGRREAQEGLEGKKAMEQTNLKRQERRLKAQSNLIVMKEKVKLAKIVHKQLPTEQSSCKLKNIRQNFRGGKTGETQLELRNQDKLKERTKLTTDRISSLKQTEFNIKDRIAIRKHKMIRPTEYQQPEDQMKENCVKTQHNFEVQMVQSESLPNRQSTPSQEEASLPNNLLHNEFISLTQYPQGQQRGSCFKIDRKEVESSLQ